MAEGASSESKGHAGAFYEVDVAVLDLVAMLCCIPLTGLDGVPDKVMLQKSSQAPLDDVVLIREQGSNRFVLERQVKKTLDIQPSRKAWKGLIDQCVRSLREHGDDIDAGRRRLGVTAREPAADLKQLRKLSDRAQQDSARHFDTEVVPSMGWPERRLWRNLVATVADALDQPGQPKPTADEVGFTAFRIVRGLVVEIEYEGRFESLASSLEERLIPFGAEYSAEDIFSRVYKLAMKWIPNEGSITRQMLRDRLSAWFILRGDPPTRADLIAAEAMTDRLLSRTADACLGDDGFRLDRASAQQGLIQALDDHQQVLVTGPAGTGKSTLAREVAAQIRQRPDATVIGMSLTEQNWRNLADIDRELGPHARFGNALVGAPTGERLLLIDGAEQALTDSGTLLRGVLALVPRDENGRLLWRVLAVAREEAARAIGKILADGGPTPVEVPVDDLGTEEVRAVLAEFPQFRPLERSQRSGRLLRNLYMVDLLATQPGGDVDFGAMAGEEDVVRLVYERLVRRDDGALRGLGAPDDRQLVYLEAAASQVHQPERFIQLSQGSAEARQGLVSDGVLTRKWTRHGFAHDVMLDYAVALWAAETPTPDLASAPQPRRLLRAIRLWGQMLLMRRHGRTARHARGGVGTTLPDLRSSGAGRLRAVG